MGRQPPEGSGRMGGVMGQEPDVRAKFAVSDYSQIGSLTTFLASVSGITVTRSPGRPGQGEQGALDVLTVVAGSSGLVAAVKMLPEFLRSRRSALSVELTVADRTFTLTATNIDQVMPLVERILRD